MSEKKVFGYPSFDSQGEKILTTYDGAYSDMLMDIRIYRMKAGGKRTFNRSGEEMALLLQKGKITLKWADSEKSAYRKDVFTEGPYCLHVCTGVEVQVEAHESDTEILVQCTHNENTFDSKFYSPKDAPWNDVCRGKFGDTANRYVNTMQSTAGRLWCLMIWTPIR